MIPNQEEGRHLLHRLKNPYRQFKKLQKQTQGQTKLKQTQILQSKTKLLTTTNTEPTAAQTEAPADQKGTKYPETSPPTMHYGNKSTLHVVSTKTHIRSNHKAVISEPMHEAVFSYTQF